MQSSALVAAQKSKGSILSIPSTHPAFPCIFLLLLIVLPIKSFSGEPAQPLNQAGFASNLLAASHQAVVAVSHPLAAEIGANILAQGGNAVDAAAAIQFALNVVEPQFSGIGGSCFMLIYLPKTGETLVVEAREKAPAAATPDMFRGLNFQEASTSGLSVGVPGTLLGIATALEKFGSISLAEALQPAIKLAEDGSRINRFLAANTDNPRTTYQPETKAVFRLSDGSPLPEGYLLKQPYLARTFRLISQHGPEIFYRGEIASAIVSAQKRSRTTDRSRGIGRMTGADLTNYNVKIRQPIVETYRGYTIKSMPPPSSGGLTLIQILKILERFPLGDTYQGFGFGSSKTLHVMIEAMRLAFADRAVWMGDEDFVSVPKADLLATPYIARRSALIQISQRLVRTFPGDILELRPGSHAPNPIMPFSPQQHENGHTTHFSVIDRWGNIVSSTSTIESVWGTGIMVPNYGFLLNNDLTDFNFTPGYDPKIGNSGANDVAAGKRPLSSMTPTIIFRDGRPVAAFGSPGGATIINTVLQITLNLLDHGMTIQQAIDAPRISVTNADGLVSREAGFSETVLHKLEVLGHPLATSASRIGSVQAIFFDQKKGKILGGADRRREGKVIQIPDFEKMPNNNNFSR